MNQSARSTKSAYAILGVGQSVTQEQIKAAWRRIAMETHPDRTPDKAKHEQYKEAAEAYDNLWHPMRRALYDKLLEVLAKCPRCGGTGMVFKQRGFTNRVYLPCPECQ